MALVLAVVVACVAAWNQQRQAEKSTVAPAALGPALKPEEGWPEKAKPRSNPPMTDEKPRKGSTGAPERPPRDRVDRPGG